MITRDDIVAEAIEWVGTPAKWGQSAKGAGCDCKGLIFGIAREVGLPEAQHNLAGERSYRRADHRLLLSSLREIMERTSNPQAGDVFVIKLGQKLRPCHLGMKINDRDMVHCYGRSLSYVARVPIGSTPIHSCWTWPSLGKG